MHLKKLFKTKKDRRQAVDLLKAAKARLGNMWPNQDHYVCNVLSIAARHTPGSWYIRDAIAEEINSRLEGAHSVIEWLQTKGYAKRTRENSDTATDYRKRWIDHMIQELT